METTLTTWEAKERAGLLALETKKWREKRRIAEDPNTTAEMLDKMTDYYNIATDWRSASEYNEYALVADALLAHPNTPPDCCSALIGIDLLHNYRAFCSNPAASLLILEIPDFWDWYEVNSCQQLLREEMLPLIAVQVFSRNEDAAVAESARLHIAMAGEIQNQREGEAAIRAAAFPRYPTRQSPPFDLAHLRQKGTAYEWMARFYAALHLPLTNTAFAGDTWNRSPLDLLEHLAHDGNRLVRWAAQTRLAAPDFAFTWHEENGDGTAGDA